MTELFSCDFSKSAVFSPCRRYRYELWRRWGIGQYCMFIGLNPSTADEMQDDPTIRRCVGFAKTWGYSALCMTNLFAWRSTDPRKMKAAADPVGPDNDATLRDLSVDAGVIIAAWGSQGKHLGRDKAVLSILPEMKCLRLTKDGSPGHPLYLPADTLPSPLTNQTLNHDTDKKEGRVLRQYQNTRG